MIELTISVCVYANDLSLRFNESINIRLFRNRNRNLKISKAIFLDFIWFEFTVRPTIWVGLSVYVTLFISLSRLSNDL